MTNYTNYLRERLHIYQRASIGIKPTKMLKNIRMIAWRKGWLIMSKKEYSRPANIEDLKKVIASLNHENAEYILIGGYALFSLGYHRATEDIDLLVPASSASSKAIIKALLILSDQESSNLKPEWFDEGENIRLADEVVVDILFKTCGETYETLKPYVQVIDIDGIPVNTLTLEGILKTKQSQRDKDTMDRVIIQKALDAIKNNKDPGPSY